MTREQAFVFVYRFVVSWTARDGEAMANLWHPDGQLFTPVVDRPVAGSELPLLLEAQLKISPDLRWKMLGWAHSGDIVYVEWRSRQTVAGIPFDWRGMDRFVVRQGLIAEERVFADTAPLRAMRFEAGRQHAAKAAQSGISPDVFVRIGPPSS